jgi:hypothetical protein
MADRFGKCLIMIHHERPAVASFSLEPRWQITNAASGDDGIAGEAI